MDYFKGVLATVAALFLAVLVPHLWVLVRTQKAGGGFLESILSPWFWIIALVFSLIFYLTGRSRNKSLRISLFWIPAIAVSVGGFGLWALFALLARAGV